MPDWDKDSPKLRENLDRLLHHIRDEAWDRKIPSLKDMKSWHSIIMHGLHVPAEDLHTLGLPEKNFFGRYRGEPELKTINVKIDDKFGVPAVAVASELEAFERRLHKTLSRLDELIPQGEFPEHETLNAVLDVCGWAHAEWVRIHPFANGNGRTARAWSNAIALRYRLPPFLRMRPRPDSRDYELAGAKAMAGDWVPTAELFGWMLREYLRNPP
jgi:hypothetical protein